MSAGFPPLALVFISLIMAVSVRILVEAFFPVLRFRGGSTDRLAATASAIAGTCPRLAIAGTCPRLGGKSRPSPQCG